MKLLIEYTDSEYECSVAVKCEHDRWIKLFDENGAEIYAFYEIADFSHYILENGSFTDADQCNIPIRLSAYAIAGVTIAPEDWQYSVDSGYQYEIKNNLFSANCTTCNITLYFAEGTELEYTATQGDGSIVLTTAALPQANIVINNIQVVRS